MTSDRAAGGRSVITGRPPRLLLAVNRPGLERLLQQHAACRVVATVRDVTDLRRHLRPQVAQALVFARGFAGPGTGPDGDLASVIGAWPVLRVGPGLPCRLPLLTTAVDRVEAVILLLRLRRLWSRRNGPA